MNTPKIHILIVDDEPQIRKFLRVALSSHDYQVSEAETGKDAAKLFSTHPPDLILLDLSLPDTNGLDII